MTVVTPQSAVAARPFSFGTAVKIAIAIALPMALLFGVAGTWDWPGAWAYIVVLLFGVAAATVVFAKFQPALLEERTRHWRDGKRWDRPFFAGVAFGPIVVQVVCGLDKRFGWSDDVGPAWQVMSGAASLAGVAITAWAMAVNPFFSAVVRIQSERGHTVVATGPYRYVRHPGYAGMLLVTFSGPVLLGTLWGLVPAALVSGILVLRAALEDRTLRTELGGYAEYASRVRHHLLPGVW